MCKSISLSKRMSIEEHTCTGPKLPHAIQLRYFLRPTASTPVPRRLDYFSVPASELSTSMRHVIPHVANIAGQQHGPTTRMQSSSRTAEIATKIHGVSTVGPAAVKSPGFLSLKQPGEPHAIQAFALALGSPEYQQSLDSVSADGAASAVHVPVAWRLPSRTSERYTKPVSNPAALFTLSSYTLCTSQKHDGFGLH